MSTSVRSVIIDALKTKFSENVAKNYENEIYKMCERKSAEQTDDIESAYIKYAYEKIGELLAEADKEMRKKIASDILTDKIEVYDSVIYQLFEEKKMIENDRVINPPSVQKSLYKCKHCKSDKTWSYQLQTRSGDEGMTTFINCSECGKRYKF